MATAASGNKDTAPTKAADFKSSDKPGDTKETLLTPATSPAGSPDVDGKVSTAGLKGPHGFDTVFGDKELSGDDLWGKLSEKAPSLTKDFASAMDLSDDDLRAIADGLIPAPPTPGPLHTADMYKTPAGYQQVAPGVTPEESDPATRTIAGR